MLANTCSSLRRDPSHRAYTPRVVQPLMLGYVYSPLVLAQDPPPPTLELAGRDFTLRAANVAGALLIAQAHDLVERSALAPGLAGIAPVPAPDDALLAVHTPEYLDAFRAACAGGPWD